MRFNEFIENIQDEGAVVIARVSSGTGLIGEIAHLVRINDNSVTVHLELSDANIRVRDNQGIAESMGRFKNVVILPFQTINRPGFVEMAID